MSDLFLYRLPLCLCWCKKKTFLQNLRDTRGICKIKDQWLADAAMASPKNESGFAIHINDSDQVGSVKVKYLCPCHLRIRGRPHTAGFFVQIYMDALPGVPGVSKNQIFFTNKSIELLC